MALWNLNGKSVLIIDDFANMRSMLKSMIQSYGAKSISQAADGEEAIELMAAHEYDLILCDYNLGEGKDGQQVLEEAKHRNLIPYSTIFVMVTAENTNAMVMGAAEYQPDAYLAKPINKTVLVSRLEKLTEKKEKLKPLSKAMQENRTSQAIALCDDLLKQDIKFKMEILKLKADLLMEQSKYEQAEAICNQVLEAREIPWALFIMGIIAFYRKQYDDACDLFQQILDKNKNFMSAYDWLAKTLQKKTSLQESQDVLMEAINQSPKSLLRQRALADIANLNEDYITTEKARKKVVAIGKTSCLREAGDYTKLARVLVKNDSSKEALKVLESTKYVFKGDNKAQLESTVELGLVYKSMGNQQQYEQAVENALELSRKDPNLIRGETALDLARSCMELHKEEEATNLVKSVAREFNEDEEMLKKIGDIYQESGKGSEGAELIDAARKEVIALNNNGVGLMQEGKTEDAVKLFMQAARELPENPTINLNAAKSIITHIRQNGMNRRMMKEAYHYLNVLLNIDPNNEKALKLHTMASELDTA